MATLTYFVGMTIDGFIAGPDGETDFFPTTDDVVAFLVEEYPETIPSHIRRGMGIERPNRHFDIGIQGRATYEPALRVGVTSPYAHLRQIVVSETLGDSPDPDVEIIRGDPVAAVRRLKAEAELGVWLTGGSKLAGALLGEIDRLVIKLYPVVAGSGVPLFTAAFSPTAFRLTRTRTLDAGAVVLNYVKA